MLIKSQKLCARHAYSVKNPNTENTTAAGNGPLEGKRTGGDGIADMAAARSRVGIC